MSESLQGGAEKNKTLPPVPDVQIYRVSGPMKLWEMIVLGGATAATLAAFWIYVPGQGTYHLLQDSLLLRTAFGLGLTLVVLSAVGLSRILKSAMAVSISSKDVTFLLGKRSLFTLSLAGLILEAVHHPIQKGRRLHSVLAFRQADRRYYFASPDLWQGGSPVRELLIQHLISLGVRYEAPLFEAQETGDEWPLPKGPVDWFVTSLATAFFLFVVIVVGLGLGLEVLDYLGYFFVPICVFLFWLLVMFLSNRRLKREDALPRFTFNSMEAKLSRKDAVLWSEDRDQLRALVLVVKKRPILGFQFRYEIETLYSRRHALTPWQSCAFNDPGPMMNRARLVGLPIKLDSEEGSTLLRWDG